MIKKTIKIAGVIIILFGILMVGCNRKIPSIKFNGNEIYMEDIIDVSDEISVEACFALDLSMESFVDNSSDIVKGTIVDIEYCTQNDLPWTVLTVEIDEVFKGDNFENELISIYDMGGYMTRSEFESYLWDLEYAVKDNQYIKMDYFQSGLYAVENEGYFYMVKSHNFENSFEPVCGSYSIVMYDSSIGEYCLNTLEKEWVNETYLINNTNMYLEVDYE